ncbi:MAG: dynamin family protein [Sporomusaceae bacterium]|nr:dynamin family protein [Sporomusaceae bacterium]
MWRNQFLNLIHRIKDLNFDAVGKQEQYSSILNDIEDSLDDEEIRITVIGEFSAGKSTFLNAIIGRDLLPHARTETTATITYIHHVAITDARCNKIVVNFYSVENHPIELDFGTNTAVLKDYLTTESEKYDVAKEISSVHVYCHLQYMDGNVTLIDTPGLNGMAESHRMMTMQEIRNAHASICIFHIRSIAESSLEYLRWALRYQKQFLFVLNFIDQLRSSEGETPTVKLNEFIAQLQEHLDESFAIHSENCFAVSALYALAGRDDMIERLYDDDIAILSSCDRQRLLAESCLSNLEKRLWQIASNERDQLLHQAAVHKLGGLLKQFSEDLQFHQRCNGVSLAEQQRNEVLERLRGQAELLANHKREQDDYITMECRLIKELMSERLSGKLADLSRKTMIEVSNMGPRDIEEVLRYDGFKRHLIKRKNDVLVWCDDVLAKMLEGVYQTALRKADSFVGDVRIKADGVPEFVVANPATTEVMFREQVRIYEEREASLDRDMAVEKEKKAQLIREIEKLTCDINRKEQDKEQAASFKKQALARLGIKPAAEIRYVTKTRTVERAILNPFRWFGDKYTTENYQAKIEDDSRGQQWENECRKIEGNYVVSLMEYEQTINELKLKIKQREKSVQDDSIIKMYQARLQDITKQKQIFMQEQKEAREKAFGEYINLQRKHLRSGVKHFFAETEKLSIASLQDTIADNRIIILIAVNEHCNNLSKKYEEKLNSLLEQNGTIAVDEIKLSVVEDGIETLLDELSKEGVWKE